MLLQPVAIQDHVSYTLAVNRWALVNMEPLVANRIVLVFTQKSHFIAFDPDVPFAPSPVFYITKAGSVAEDLDGISLGVPASAKIMVLRSEFLLKTGRQRANDDE